MRWAAFLAMLGAATACASPVATSAEAEVGATVPAKGPLDTLDDVQTAFFACWKWPPESEAHDGMVLRFILSFKRNGEILGGRLTYVDQKLSAEERDKFSAALSDAIKLCSPLPISPALGEGIAGQPFVFTLTAPRKE
ncbi:MAG: hypothetical protein K2Y27_22095 [Xanthobacteraceae bacterium]|nr:hypothetical protein [Xanthobacteraceae bacterium]